ncbi:MAG TPA: cation:proton antiporter, partial [Candidatus Thermoplasmatota archaeon]|nr:cation:proton antiporter [Candidatus Thermoplasmatota archaeon]
MAEDLALIRDLALVLVTAGVTALLFHKLRLSPILGYLAAGVLVGPHVQGFPLVQDAANVAVLAQLGVIFLLFSLGLHFHLGRLRQVGGLALTAGVLEVSLMVGMGFLVAGLFDWGFTDALFLGAILAISSTTLIVKVLSDQGRLRDPSTEAVFGILLVEDVVAVLLIALLSSIALTGTVSAAAVGELLVRIAIFIVATLVLGLVVLPRLVDYVARLKVDEILVLIVVGAAFAVAMMAVALDLSLALGAFIAGAIVAESRASALVERRIAPLRDVFTAVFFVSTGILLVPADVLAYWPAIAILAVVCIVGKMAAVGFATFVAGYPPAQAMRVGISMAMIGEFSFVIAQLGRDLEVTAPFLFPVAVSVSAVTALVTPALIRRSDAIVRALSRVLPAPWRAYAATYSAWVDRIRPRGADAYSGGYDTSAVVRALSYAAVLLGIGFGANLLDDAVLRAYGDRRLVAVAFYAIVALVAVPILIGLGRAVRDLVGSLVKVVVPPAQLETRRGQAAAAVLRNTLYVFLGAVLLVVAVAAGAAFLPPLPLLLGAAVVVVAAAFLLRGSLRRLDAHLEEAVDTLFRGQASGASRDQVLNLIREKYPWDMHVESVVVPIGSRAANRRIRDLALPQKTGATIVTHEHEGVQVVNPPPETVLHPGDTVGILGEREQVEAARALLTTE